jgi:ABC-type dipeptide/oligopeptide/nickel transport system permease component
VVSAAYIAQRLIHGLFVLVGVTAVVFGLTFLTGDPASVLVPLDSSPAEIDRFRHDMGLDRPVPIQYLDFLRRAVRGDFGDSFRHHSPAMPLVIERVPATAKLSGVSLFFALLISVPLGILAALHHNRRIDGLTRMATLLGQSVPAFWLAIVLILLFGVYLRWLPSSGGDTWQSLVLPGLTVGAASAAALARLLRSSLIDVLTQDYIRTAYAKGLGRGATLLQHALKNAAIPFLSFLALQFVFVLSNAVVVESIFAYPGMGRLAVEAITTRDVPVIQAFVTVAAIAVVLVNIVVDVAYTRLDPRIRLGH